MIPEGIIPPVLTPLTREQDVDQEAFCRLLDKLIAGGVHGLFIAGTAGFGSILTDAQHEWTVRLAVRHVAGRLPVLSGVLEPSTARVLERIRRIESSGVLAVVVVAPYYLRAQNERQLLRHFEIIRESTNLEMVLYNLPGCVGTAIPVQVFGDMAKRGWISACKDSSGDSEYFSELCRRGAENGLRVYQGMRPVFATLVELGAAGCVPVPGNVFPELYVQAWNKRTEQAELPGLQERCDQAWKDLVVGTDFFSRSLRRLAEEGLGAGVMPEPFSA